MNRNERTSERNLSNVRGQNPSRSLSPAGRDPYERLFRWAGFLDDDFMNGSRGSSSSLAPCIDVEEDEDSYEVTVELPGMKQNDVQVELNQNVLTIAGEKRSSFGDGGKESQGAKRRSRWSERSYGRFTRSFTLPADADADHLAARFSDGVLTISIPKSEESKPRMIEIQSTGQHSH